MLADDRNLERQRRRNRIRDEFLKPLNNTLAVRDLGRRTEMFQVEEKHVHQQVANCGTKGLRGHLGSGVGAAYRSPGTSW